MSEESVPEFPPPDAGEELADEPESAFGETDDDEAEAPLPGEPEEPE